MAISRMLQLLHIKNPKEFPSSVVSNNFLMKWLSSGWGRGFRRLTYYYDHYFVKIAGANKLVNHLKRENYQGDTWNAFVK